MTCTPFIVFPAPIKHPKVYENNPVLALEENLFITFIGHMSDSTVEGMWHIFYVCEHCPHITTRVFLGSPTTDIPEWIVLAMKQHVDIEH